MTSSFFNNFGATLSGPHALSAFSLVNAVDTFSYVKSMSITVGVTRLMVLMEVC